MVRHEVCGRPYHRPRVTVRRDGRLTGALLVALAAACFGTLGTLTRFSDDAGVGPLALVSWRAAIGALTVAAISGVRIAAGHRPFLAWDRVPRREWAYLAGGVLSGATLNLAIFVAFTRISIALTLLVFYSYPTIVSLVSVVRFGERFDRLRASALAASIIGLILVFAGAGSLGAIDPLGAALAAIAALSQVYYVLAARHGFPGVPSAQAAIVTMGGGALVYVVAAAAAGVLPLLGEPLTNVTGLGLAVLAGTIGAGLPTLAFILGIRRLGPPRAAVLATLEPVVGVTLAALFLGEVPMPIQLVGGVLVIVGGVLSQLGAPSVAAEHEAVVASPEASSRG